jgi:hypothetical protein
MGANSWVKRGKRDIVAGVVVKLRVIVVGFVRRLRCCGMRWIGVRSACINELMGFGSGDGLKR